jgi:hypothetical protein
MLILWIVITAGITGCEWLSAVVTAPLFGGAPWWRLASLLVLLSGIVILDGHIDFGQGVQRQCSDSRRAEA